MVAGPAVAKSGKLLDPNRWKKPEEKLEQETRGREFRRELCVPAGLVPLGWGRHVETPLPFRVGWQGAVPSTAATGKVKATWKPLLKVQSLSPLRSPQYHQVQRETDPPAWSLSPACHGLSKEEGR